MENCIGLKLEVLTENDAKETSTWQYESPYDVYSSWSWEKMLEENEPMTIPDERSKNHLGLFDKENNLLGFVAFSYPEANVTRIGLGLKPNVCGKGLGEAFARLIIEEAKKRNPLSTIDLEVLTWNKRAFKVYQRSGFQLVETYTRKTPTGLGEFHRMVYAK